MYTSINSKLVRTNTDRNKADLFAALMLQKLGGEKVNYMKLMKLLYFADRYHLRKYMRPIAKDDYYALQKGVIGSYWLDLLRGNEQSRFFDSDGEYTVTLRESLEEKYLDKFSESELEALNFVMDNFSKFDEYQLVDIIHKYPEWKKYESRFEEYGGRENIDLKDILDDPEDNSLFRSLNFNDPFCPLSTNDKDIVLDALEDYIVESL